ncbi:MAG: hypothetical protein Q3962_04960 [Corynebacterium sp.]|nr:hypothetical protein [Corynebacterium sp.]
MAKRKNKWSKPHRPLTMGIHGGARTEEGPSWDFGRPYQVHNIPAAQARKHYICPGCNSDIFPGESHIVAWADPEFRRHWHNRCWDRR